MQQLPGDLIVYILQYLSLHELGMVQCASHLMFASVFRTAPEMVLGLIPSWLPETLAVSFDVATAIEHKVYTAAYVLKKTQFGNRADETLRTRMVLFMAKGFHSLSGNPAACTFSLLAHAVRLLDHFELKKTSPQARAQLPLSLMLVTLNMVFKMPVQDIYDKYITKIIDGEELGNVRMPAGVQDFIERFKPEHEEEINMIPLWFFSRIAQAAGVDPRTADQDGGCSVEYSLFNYFVVVSSLDLTISGFRPSLIAAAAMACTLKVLGRREWSALLYFVTKHTLAKVLVASNLLMSQGRFHRGNEVLELKYTCPMFGGGIWDKLQEHYGFVCEVGYFVELDELLAEFVMGVE
jgi:hypothetical protein